MSRRLVAIVAPLVLVLASCTTGSDPTATDPTPALDPIPTTSARESAETTDETAERAAGTIPGSGTFKVGADIEPGLYFSRASLSRGYWARLKGAPGDADDIIASGNPARTEYVQVAAKDKYFVSVGMEDWVLVDPGIRAVIDEAYSAFNSGDVERWLEMRIPGSYYESDEAREKVTAEMSQVVGARYTKIRCEAMGEGEWPSYDREFPVATGFYFICDTVLTPFSSDSGGPLRFDWVIADGAVVAARSRPPAFWTPFRGARPRGP